MRRRRFLQPLQAAAAAFCFLAASGCSSAVPAAQSAPTPAPRPAPAPAPAPAVIDLSGAPVAALPLPSRAEPTPASTPAPERPRVISPGSSTKTPPAAAGASSPAAAAHASALARVEALIDEPTCGADAQCRTVAMGARACGGPVGYRAWSTAVTDAAALAEASQRERDLALQVEREAGRMSICLFLADPGAQCVRGRCETRATPSPKPQAR